MGINPPVVPKPPKPPGGGGSGGGGSGGGGYSGGGGSGGGGSSGGGSTKGGLPELTAAQRKSIIDNVTAAWRLFVKRPGGTPPKDLIDKALKSRGMDPGTMQTWVRVNTPQQYMRSKVAYDRALEIVRLLNTTFGVDYKPDDKEIKALKLKYVLGDPGKGDIESFFQNHLRKLVPGFDAWFSKAQTTKGYATAYEALDDFNKARTEYRQWYQTVMGSGAPIPEDLLTSALSNNWTDIEFQEAVRNTSAWAGSSGAQARDEEFLREWESLFAGTPFSVPSASMLDKYRKGSMSFAQFLLTDVKDSPEFSSAFPEYAEWESNMHKQGYGEDRATPFSFLQLRAGFVQRYREMMKDNSAVPPADLLSRAVSGNWSTEQFDNEIKSKDPKYSGTPDFKDRADAFAWYWKSVMGSAAPVDQGLADQYAKGYYSNPQQMFDQIQASPEFAAQYPDWATFAAAQTASGNNAVENPLLYKQYQKAFYDAFANQGIGAPAGFEHLFFASGVDPNDFSQNIEQFTQQKESYNWQTGQQADLATAAGIGNKTVGGDLRKRLAEALTQHRTFAESKYQPFRAEEVAGNIAQRI